jgi:hypothetical protein
MKHLLHEDWQTAEIMDVCRASEILDWLKRHLEEVDNFIIIDDQDIFERNSPPEVGPLLEHIVTTDRHNGMLFDHQCMIIDLLTDENKTHKTL